MTKKVIRKEVKPLQLFVSVLDKYHIYLETGLIKKDCYTSLMLNMQLRFVSAVILLSYCSVSKS